MKRGEIWATQFPLASRQNSEPYGHGPVVIVSSDRFNDSAIQTVLVAVLTTNIKLERAPGNVFLLADQDNGLAQDSVANVSQILVIDRERLQYHWGRLDDSSLEELDMGLRLVFSL